MVDSRYLDKIGIDSTTGNGVTSPKLERRRMTIFVVFRRTLTSKCAFIIFSVNSDQAYNSKALPNAPRTYV
jgi:hypothetical protein